MTCGVVERARAGASWRYVVEERCGGYVGDCGGRICDFMSESWSGSPSLSLMRVNFAA